MNPAAQKALAARDARLAAHCREGFRLVRDDPAYGSVVLARLAPELGEGPEDMWSSIPWIWAIALGGEPPAGGAMAGAARVAGVLLRAWLGGDELLDTLEARWKASAAAPLPLGSTLRSHPFSDLRVWSIRPMFAASSPTPHGS